MSTVYLHIGTPKTGTSAIQMFCEENRAILEKNGICYPKFPVQFKGIGIHRNAYFLSNKVYQSGKRNHQKEQEIRQKCYDVLREKVQKFETIVISDEHIWNEKELNSENFAKLKDIIEDMGATLKVIVYLRRQDLVVQSYWAQQVKEGEKSGFKEYIDNQKYTYFELDYEKRIGEIAQSIGKENIIVHVYEKQQYKGKQQNIISDFLNIFGQGLKKEYKQKELVHNVSLSGIYLELKRYMNQYPEYCTKQNFFVNVLTKLQAQEEGVTFFQTGIYFGRQDQFDFLAQYDRGNEAIAREYLKREDGALFWDEIKNDEEKATSYSEKELLALCSRAFLKQEEDRAEKARAVEDLRASIATLNGSASVIRKGLYFLQRVFRKLVRMVRHAA